ncbi:hypothetical protein MANES_07G068080v8 [Manihot esculenta]|uniref:Uncharacterized protein n=1 Tax=Manihot esculenta TaxID=3983 RepID=A0ACB7HFR1_MANES|nr:hypothetical protein MANES_07G068080v8 [Manihot esculenta]
MTKAWNPRKGVELRIIHQNLFSFQLHLLTNKQRVLDTPTLAFRQARPCVERLERVCFHHLIKFWHPLQSRWVLNVILLCHYQVLSTMVLHLFTKS